MLRVYTPASPHPTITGRSPIKQSHADGLRRQIVDMVQQQGLNTPKTFDEPEPEIGQKEQDNQKELENQKEKENQKEEKSEIYQIRKKGGIASVAIEDENPNRKNDKLKKIHLKILRETRGKGARSFPSSHDDQLHDGPIGEDGRISASKDPYKRPRSFSGLVVKGPSKPNFKSDDRKLVRISDESKDNVKSSSTPLPPHIMNNSVNASEQKYEIRGSAIRTKSTRSAPISKSAEAQRRHMTIHTSLQLFKRRLKFSHPDHYIQAKPSTNESDYVIRRVPMKYDKSNRISVASPAPLEPRLQVLSYLPQRVKTPNTLVAATPTAIMSRPVSVTEVNQFGEQGEKKIRYSYRLPENFNWSKEVSFRDETEMIPNVNTYVVEQGVNKCSSSCQATLSTHNVGVHNALTLNTDRKVKVGHSDEEFDPRFVRWLEESNSTNPKVYMRQPSAASLPSVRTPEPKIEILETINRCKTPFPDK